MLNKIFFFLFIFTFGLFSIIRKQRSPCDVSNRWNKAILFWLVFNHAKRINVLTWNDHGATYSQWHLLELAFAKEEFFVPMMPWLKYDMWERLQNRFK